MPILSSLVVLRDRGARRAGSTVRRELRARGYDVAIDFQGLLKSAALARLSGAARVVGFERGALREGAAAPFYTERVPVDDGQHVIRKNLQLAAAVGLRDVGRGTSSFRSRRSTSPVDRRHFSPASAARSRCSIPARPGPTSDGRPIGWRRRARRFAIATASCPSCSGDRRRGRRRRPSSTASNGAARARAADRASRSGRARARRAADGVRRHRTDAHRGRARRAGRRALRSDQSAARNGPWAARRHLDLALRHLRLPLRAPLPARRRRTGASARFRWTKCCRRSTRVSRAAARADAGGRLMLQSLARLRVPLGFRQRRGRARARAADRRNRSWSAARSRCAGELVRVWAAGTSRRAAKSRAAARIGSCAIRSISARRSWRSDSSWRRATSSSRCWSRRTSCVTYAAAIRTEEATLDAAIRWRVFGVSRRPRRSGRAIVQPRARGRESRVPRGDRACAGLGCCTCEAGCKRLL